MLLVTGGVEHGYLQRPIHNTTRSHQLAVSVAGRASGNRTSGYRKRGGPSSNSMAAKVTSFGRRYAPLLSVIFHGKNRHLSGADQNRCLAASPFKALRSPAERQPGDGLD